MIDSLRDPLPWLIAAVAALAVLLLIADQPNVEAAFPVPKRPDLVPPKDWLRPGEALAVPGRTVHYWGAPIGTKNPSWAYYPKVVYGRKVTARKRPFRAIVIHWTGCKPVEKLIQYQHAGDSDRGGSMGYHFYVPRSGQIYQGAPLSARTNHIKRRGHGERTDVGAWVESSEAIGVSAICGAGQDAGSAVTSRHVWRPSDEQREAIVAVIAAIRARYAISCKAVYGHGEVQHDRNDQEGAALAQILRAKC